MARSTIQERAMGDILPVMDHHSPELHEQEEAEVRKFLEREDEGEDVIWQALEKSIDGVERQCRVRSGHDPLMMCLMHMLVDGGMMQTAVDEVNAAVGEKKEERELQIVVPRPWGVCD